MAKLETSIQNETMIELSKAGHYCLRVNSGEAWGGKVLAHDGARLLLDHPTKVMLAPAGTSDIIGCITRTITPDMVGTQIAQFAVCEVKQHGKKPEPNQQQYIALMRSRGAVAGWADNPEDAVKLWTR